MSQPHGRAGLGLGLGRGRGRPGPAGHPPDAHPSGFADRSRGKDKTAGSATSAVITPGLRPGLTWFASDTEGIWLRPRSARVAAEAVRPNGRPDCAVLSSCEDNGPGPRAAPNGPGPRAAPNGKQHARHRTGSNTSPRADRPDRDARSAPQATLDRQQRPREQHQSRLPADSGSVAARRARSAISAMARGTVYASRYGAAIVVTTTATRIALNRP